MPADAARPAATLRSAADLVAAGLALPEQGREMAEEAERYAVAITPIIGRLIDPADPADPIARQFVPSAAELAEGAGESPDPIGDAPHSPVKGVVHRYPDRVLLKPVHACPVYCRFCFRREMVGPGGEALDAAELAAALEYIATRPAIWEVILSGGDPLMLSPRRLAGIVARLATMEHVGILRVHTRIAVADPGRISPALVDALRSRLPVYVVLHCNHPRELTPEARAACSRFVDAGIPMLSQTVLLKGVNDRLDILATLFRELVRNRVKPYYLHHPDLAPGTGHFRLTIAEGQALVRALRGTVSGLCQPTYVLDIPGGHGKVPVGPGYLEPDGRVRDPAGVLHEYRDGCEPPAPSDVACIAAS